MVFDDGMDSGFSWIKLQLRVEEVSVLYIYDYGRYNVLSCESVFCFQFLPIGTKKYNLFKRQK